MFIPGRPDSAAFVNRENLVLSIAAYFIHNTFEGIGILDLRDEWMKANQNDRPFRMIDSVKKTGINAESYAKVDTAILLLKSTEDSAILRLLFEQGTFIPFATLEEDESNTDN